MLKIFKSLKEQIPDHVTLVAVSKTKPDEMILEAYRAGHRDFGENKVQDLAAKQERLPDDIRWHMIGHLQSNKVKYLASFVHMIHGVDSLKLLRVINKEASEEQPGHRLPACRFILHRRRRNLDFPGRRSCSLVQSDSFREMKNIRIRGVMGMATYTENSEQIREEFRHLKRIFEELKAICFLQARNPSISFPSECREIISWPLRREVPWFALAA